MLHSPSDSGRAAAEQLIRRVYRAAYAADIAEFLPLLLELQGRDSAVAVLGMRPARVGQPLFLEHYLDRPIEQEIAAHAGRPVARSDVVEIGNLAAAMPGVSAPLFLVMAAALAASDHRWLAFTATPQVERLVVRLNYAPLVLHTVDATRLGADAGCWGSYYATGPRVMGCDLAAALARGAELPRVQALLAAYAPAIEHIARQLRNHGSAV